MAVRIRLQRGGRKGAPYYRVGVFDAHTRRQGRMIEKLGYYHPMQEKDGQFDFKIDLERVKYWLSVGAQPTDTVNSLIKRAGK